MIKLAIDAMGADKGSSIIVKAIKQYHAKNKDVHFYVVGKKEELQELTNIATIIDSKEVITNNETPTGVLRKKESSMYKAVDLAAMNEVDGVVSCGSTGAFLTAATLLIKRIPNVDRAALTTFFPTATGQKLTVLDVGASNEATTNQLVQFAKMGRIFSHKLGEIANPRVYLLANGAEENKGNQLVKETHQTLKQYGWFKGNVEAREALNGTVDVLVADGNVGNVFLKTVEGTALFVGNEIKRAFKRNIISKIGGLLARKGFRLMKERLDYKKYGGAILLGINKVVVKAHGSSDTEAFTSAIIFAVAMVKADIVSNIKMEVEGP